MNWDLIKGKWSELKGDARQRWGKLTDSDWDQIGGKKDELLGRLQKNYGYGKDKAESEVNDFFSNLDNRTRVREKDEVI
jgi:uncharacterized protein YjbJ (UPF0337 family)